MITDPALAAFAAALVAAGAFAAAWWSRERRLHAVRQECERLRGLAA
jgi:hypothetical protein